MQVERATWSNNTIVIYKSHEFDHGLLTVCKDVIVLTTLHGCIEQLVASLVSVNFAALDTHALLWNLDLSLREHAQWREVASLVQTVAEPGNDPLHNFATVYHTLSLSLGIPYKHRNFSHLLQNIHQHTDSEKIKRVLNSEMKKRIRNVVHKLHARLHRDQRLEGTQWFCDLS